MAAPSDSSSLPAPPSSLKARLQAFLPEIAQANEAIAARVAAGQDVRVDASLREDGEGAEGEGGEPQEGEEYEEEQPVGAAEAADARVVEMSLALGEVDDSVAAALEGPEGTTDTAEIAAVPGLNAEEEGGPEAGVVADLLGEATEEAKGAMRPMIEEL